MCGIAGHISSSDEFSPELLNEMCRSIYHRGPDDHGEYRDQSVALGMRRLSIIDLETGQQPITNEDGSVITICNGEIYNYRELRRRLIRKGHQFRSNSDVEVIVHLYEEVGENFASELEGMFAFALWDARRSRLILGRDRFGMKPLFMAKAKRGGLLFCSEIKGILTDASIGRNIDVQALDSYFAYQYVPSPRTIYSDISKLPPAHIAIVNSRCQVEIRRYWQLDGDSEEKRAEDHVAEVERLMMSAVRRHLVSDVPLGTFLSGGIDSGLVAAMMAKASQDVVRTFTVRFPGEKGGVRDESLLAASIAKHIGADHVILDVKPDFSNIVDQLSCALDEPFADDSIIPSYYVCLETSKHVKVAMSGLGGDELFAGYRRHLGHRWADTYKRFVPNAGDQLLSRLVGLGKESASSGNFRDQARRFLQSIRLSDEERYTTILMSMSQRKRREIFVNGLIDESVARKTDRYFFSDYISSPKDDALSRALYVDMNSYLTDDVLMLTDRISMLHSLEVRVPFLDRELVEKVWSLPSGQKIRGISQKYLLRQVAARWLPKSILAQPKQGFEAPMSAWLRGPLEGYCRDLLSEETIRRQGVFEYSHVKQLIDSHVSGQQRNNKIIFSMMMFQIWYDNQPAIGTIG